MKSTELAQRYVEFMSLSIEFTHLWNDLGFSLYTVLSVCHMVATLDEWKKSKMGLSTDLVYCH